MIYRKLGTTGIDVSAICLGSMTWGRQNTESEGHEQLDYATGHGINFIDTAEMYAIPPTTETFGTTESIIGNWLSKRKNRDKLIIASKVIGRADWMSFVRDGTACLDRKNIETAIDGSLRRLQTDYIDLYQLHWPDRQTNFFGKLGYPYPTRDNGTDIEETLSVLADLVKTGKIRHVGISNETPWGVHRFLQAAETRGYPRIVSIQNPYSLLNRSFEVGLAEFSHRERIGLLAYSPLGFGILSGKYTNGARPEGARLTLFENYSRYCKPNALKAVDDYVALANKHGLSPAQMALAYVTSRPFTTSTIIGATSMDQLSENIDSCHTRLSEEVLDGIEAIHQRYPNPSP